jgi:hypothetical protein
MEPYLSGQFGFIDDPDSQFGNGLVWARTRTQRDGPDPLLTLSAMSLGLAILFSPDSCSYFSSECIMLPLIPPFGFAAS